MATHVIRVSAGEVPGLIAKKQQEVIAAIRASAIESANRALRKVRADSPVDMGQYKNSWEVVEGTGDQLAQLRNDAPHAGVIENGARPGFWPPLAALYEWVLRHASSFDIGRSSRKLVGRRTSLRRAPKERSRRLAALRIAKLIQLKIHARGLRPHWVNRKQLSFIVAAQRQSFNRRLRELASRK